MADWIDPYEAALVATAAVAAVSCALPGLWLVLRRLSMMGDAMSHSALLGVVGSLVAVNTAAAAGWVTPGRLGAAEDVALLVGSVAVGVLTSFLTETLRSTARVEPGAALGVVFSSLFAAGLFLVRWAADSAHIDADCVLFGSLEMEVIRRGWLGLPRPLLLNAAALLVNAVLMAVCFKELRLASFDPDYARTQGLRSGLVHYGLMTAVSLTVVAAFTTVGSILVIGLLVVPAATALLLSRTLKAAVFWTVAAALLSAVLSRVLCRTLPAMAFGGWGVSDSSTAGMMAVAGGGLFALAWLFSPRGGVVVRSVRQVATAVRSEADQLLGILYRLEERGVRPTRSEVRKYASDRFAGRPLVGRLAVGQLRREGLVLMDGREWRLTEPGRRRASRLIRGHRLLEAYLGRHFALPEDHLHEATRPLERYLDPDLRERLAEDLDRPSEDPHGRAIPGPPKPGG